MSFNVAEDILFQLLDIFCIKMLTIAFSCQTDYIACFHLESRAHFAGKATENQMAKM